MQSPFLDGDTMKRIVAVLVAVALLVAGMAAPATAGAVVEDAVRTQVGTAGPPSNESLSPGARLSGMVAVQGAEVEGELDGRTFGISVARANSDAARASVVADEVTELDSRLAELRERKRDLEAARENGTVSDARYRAEIAALRARTAAAEGQLNRTQVASDGLPADLLAERGVDASAIETLRTEARNLSGPETAAIARSIGGPNAGRSLSSDGNASSRPAAPGLQDPPGASNGSDRPTSLGPPTSSIGSDGPERPGAVDGDRPSADHTTGNGPPAAGSAEGGPPVNVTQPVGPGAR